MDFTPERRTRVDARKAELRAAMPLHELRQARAMTQKAVGEVLEVNDGLRPVVDARLYPNELMTDFNLELENWIRDGRALKYFRERMATRFCLFRKSLPRCRHPVRMGHDG